MKVDKQRSPELAGLAQQAQLDEAVVVFEPLRKGRGAVVGNLVVFQVQHLQVVVDAQYISKHLSTVVGDAAALEMDLLGLRVLFQSVADCLRVLCKEGLNQISEYTNYA